MGNIASSCFEKTFIFSFQFSWFYLSRSFCFRILKLKCLTLSLRGFPFPKQNLLKDTQVYMTFQKISKLILCWSKKSKCFFPKRLKQHLLPGVDHVREGQGCYHLAQTSKHSRLTQKHLSPGNNLFAPTHLTSVAGWEDPRADRPLRGDSPVLDVLSLHHRIGLNGLSHNRRPLKG